MDAYQLNQCIELLATTSSSTVTFTDFTPAQASFTGSVAGTVLTVTALSSGTIKFNQLLGGSGVTANTIIRDQLSGTPGGVGTYALSLSQTVGSEAMTATEEGQISDFPDVLVYNASSQVAFVTDGPTAVVPTTGGAGAGQGMYMVPPNDYIIIPKATGTVIAAIVGATTAQLYIASINMNPGSY